MTALGGIFYAQSEFKASGVADAKYSYKKEFGYFPGVYKNT